jgi:hypothetical protein
MTNYPVNQTFDPKDPEEIIPLEFDFSQLGTGFASPVVTVTHIGGVADPDAADMVLAAPTITDNVAVVAIQSGVDNADYLVRCTAMQGAMKYVISGVLPVRVAVGRYSQSTILD